ncbi:glycoside hydrolase superfamily [Spinellus fusiger]|nr:glycoside hydrolase superfamily [Spinellus fusiger]
MQLTLIALLSTALAVVSVQAAPHAPPTHHTKPAHHTKPTHHTKPGTPIVAPQDKSTGGSLWGITYTAKHPDFSCQTQDEILKTIQQFNRNNIRNIRTYSQECNQLAYILSAIAKTNTQMKVLAAVWIDGTAKDDQEIKTLVSTLKNTPNKSAILGITVGNEVIQNRVLNSAAMAAKVRQVKSQVGSIPVGIVDTPQSFDDTIVLASDIVVVNIYPYFGGVNVQDAKNNFMIQYNAFLAKTHNKPVLVGETGWPSDGGSINNAVASVQNLGIYLNAMKQVTNVKYFYFESVDAPWKGTTGVEPHWGVWDVNGKSKVSSMVN